MSEQPSKPNQLNPTGPESRNELLRAVDGDRDARERLLSGHWEALRSFVHRRFGRGLRAHESSVDIVQSIYREALEDMSRIEYRGRDSFRRWLYRCAENKLRDRGRHWAREKRSPRREVLLASLSPEDAGLDALHENSSPSDRAIATEALDRIEQAFSLLPPDYQRVIQLARVEGLPHEAVALEMGRTPLATRSLLSRALARLALALEEPA